MIRKITENDFDSVVEIYNQAIDARFQTAFTERFRPEERTDWFRLHLGDAYPMYVYICDGVVAGWCSISPFREGRKAFRYCVEISYFLHRGYQKRGIGPQLLQYGIDACRRLQYKNAVALILDKNVPSQKLLERAGFEQWAFLPNIADFDGEECSHVFYGLKLA